MSPITLQLANYLFTSKLSDIDQTVQAEARRSLLNWLGCAIAGSRDQTVETALAVSDEFSGPRLATVFGRTERLDALNAAFINGISSSVHTFDDTHLATLIHPTGPIAAALLALSEIRTISGADFLHALILGMEVECRLGNVLIVPPAVGNVGWFMTGLAGAVGAAVAVGKALHFSEQRFVWAIGSAVLQAAGLRQVHASMGQSFPTGHAARAGLLAALLAEKNFTSSDTTLEGPKGFGHVYAQQPNFAALTNQLGQVFEMSLNTYKPYPCGIVIHPAIDACFEACQAGKLLPDSIGQISLVVHPLALDLTGRINPENSFEAQFSVYHWVACAVTLGAAGIQQGTDVVVRDPAIAAFRKRISITVQPSYSRSEASIEIVLRDGRVLTAHVLHCRGSAERPLTDDELSSKFLALVSPLLGEAKAHEIRLQCSEIETSEVSLLAKSCAP